MRAQSLSVCLSVERAVSQGGRQPWRAPCNRPSAAAMTSLTRFYLLTTTWITNGAWYVTFISTFAFSKMHEDGPGKLLLFKWDLKSLCDEYGDYILLECNVVAYVSRSPGLEWIYTPDYGASLSAKTSVFIFIIFFYHEDGGRRFLSDPVVVVSNYTLSHIRIL